MPEKSPVHELVDHLFRHEAGKLSATLSRAYGLCELAVIDDIVQETMLTALEQWSMRPLPDDPTAWLHRVALRKALDHFRHVKRRGAREAGRIEDHAETYEEAQAEEPDALFLVSEISDSELRMIFAICDPGIAPESQIALTLKTLCGFSVSEIANAFLTQNSTIEKRLQRARTYFRDRNTRLEPPTGVRLQQRLQPVLSTLYLLFNEGYKRSHSAGLVERDLCLEALRLALLISERFGEEYGECYALVAVMAFHAARFDSRMDASGSIVLLPSQDRSQWNSELLQKATFYFIRSSPESHESAYHLEAAIQYFYCSAPTFQETNWPGILGLYRRLYRIKPTPIVALHMSVSIAEVFGPEEALDSLSSLPLEGYYLYHALRGEFLTKLGRWDDAAQEFLIASERTENIPEKELLGKKRTQILKGRLPPRET